MPLPGPRREGAQAAAAHGAGSGEGPLKHRDDIGCDGLPVECESCRFAAAGWLDVRSWRFRAGLALERRQLPQPPFLLPQDGTLKMGPLNPPEHSSSHSGVSLLVITRPESAARRLEVSSVLLPRVLVLLGLLNH